MILHVCYLWFFSSFTPRKLRDIAVVSVHVSYQFHFHLVKMTKIKDFFNHIRCSDMKMHRSSFFFSREISRPTIN